MLEALRAQARGASRWDLGRSDLSQKFNGVIFVGSYNEAGIWSWNIHDGDWIYQVVQHLWGNSDWARQLSLPSLSAQVLFF